MGTTQIVDKNGQLITAHVLQKQVPQHYWKVCIENLIQNLGNMTPKSMIVIDYVLNNTNPYNNKYAYLGTNKDIAEKCKNVGYSTVARTLSFLKKHDIITRKSGVIMWNPSILNSQIVQKVAPLIINYKVMKGDYKKVNFVKKAYDRKRIAKARRVLANKRESNSKNAHQTNIYDYIKSTKNKKPVKNE